MSAEIKVPDIGDFEDVPVVDILVAEGDEVAKDDPLVTLESDKSSMDIPSPQDGTIDEMLIEVGDSVSEGDVICTVSGDGGDDDSDGEGASGSSDGEDAEGEGGDSEDEGDDDSGDAEAGEGSTGEGDSEDGDASDDEGSDDVDEGADQGESAHDGDGDGADQGEPTGEGSADGNEDGDADAVPADATPTQTVPSGDPIYASPAVRRLARQEDVDLSKVEGTGRKGRITKEDVNEFEETGGAAGAGDEASAGDALDLDLARWPETDFSEFGEVEVIEQSRIKQISAPNLHRNWIHIPHVTHHDDADITELEAFRKKINSEQDVKVTMVALLAKALVPVLKQFPTFNSSLLPDGKLAVKKYYNIGFAADTPQGLLVPVIRDADTKGLLEIAAELIELSGKAREGKLGPKSMKGSTITISSLGGIGGTGFTPIVNAPEVAILGVTRSEMKPVWNAETEEFDPRLMVPLSLSYDHRVVDGAEAARFTVELTKVLSDFRRVIL